MFILLLLLKYWIHKKSSFFTVALDISTYRYIIYLLAIKLTLISCIILRLTKIINIFDRKGLQRFVLNIVQHKIVLGKIGYKKPVLYLSLFLDRLLDGFLNSWLIFFYSFTFIYPRCFQNFRINFQFLILTVNIISVITLRLLL